MQAANLQVDNNTRWWREWQVLVMLALVAVIYTSRLTLLPLRGEETRRAMVAREILWTGDWIVPRQQGEPFLSRPPLGSYPIALAAIPAGEVSPLATRLPTAIATLLTCLLIYGYCRQFLSATGALAGGLGYASMGQVLQFGQIAETEATFTLLVAASLLIWHWGYMQRWSAYAMWSLAYFFVGLGTLAKGPQAPVYFAASVGAYLLFVRDWRTLIQPAHFAGIGVFAIVLGAWQIPFFWQLGWPAVESVWAGDVKLRFVDQTWQSVVIHVLTYPGEVWLYLLPSSLLLLPLLRPAFWRSVAQQHAWAVFVVIAVLITFPSCWFVPGAKPRYFMPLYPCIAALVGLVVEQLLQPGAHTWIARAWKAHQHLLLTATWGTLAMLIVWAALPSLPFAEFRQPLSFIGICVLICSAASLVLWRFRQQFHPLALECGLLATTALVGMWYSGVVLNVSLQRSENAAVALAKLKNRLPENTKLASIGLVETMFTYHYGRPVTYLPDTEGAITLPPQFDYFCVNQEDGKRVKIPFAWQQEAVISCDRWKRDRPRRVVIVGRRLPQMASDRNTLNR